MGRRRNARRVNRPVVARFPRRVGAVFARTLPANSARALPSRRSRLCMGQAVRVVQAGSSAGLDVGTRHCSGRSGSPRGVRNGPRSCVGEYHAPPWVCRREARHVLLLVVPVSRGGRRGRSRRLVPGIWRGRSGVVGVSCSTPAFLVSLPNGRNRFQTYTAARTFAACIFGPLASRFDVDVVAGIGEDRGFVRRFCRVNRLSLADVRFVLRRVRLARDMVDGYRSGHLVDEQ